MFVPLQWLVLFFFLIIVIVAFLAYEIDSKFKWKIEAEELEKKITEIKSNRKQNNLTEIYSNSLKGLKEKLTNRQFEIFLLTIEGHSSKDIAEQLHIAPTTIDWHIKDIKEKLNVNKRSQFAGIFLEELKKSLTTKEEKE